MNYNDHRPGLKARAAHLALALSSAAAVLTLGVSAVTAMPASAAGMASDVAQALKLRLPKTPIDAISCDTLGPWCEVVSGDTLFYIDETARYLFVGRLYDMEERRDVTAARLLELNPDLLAAGAARVASDAPAGRDEAPVQAAASHVDLSSLPAAGAIHWGNPKGERLVVFSDFQCGYCQRLAGELAKARVHVEERPISIFGAASRKISEAVLCAKDPAKALHAAYAGQGPATGKTCKDAKVLDANEVFAKANGFAGTPVIVRARGTFALGAKRKAILAEVAYEEALSGEFIALVFDDQLDLDPAGTARSRKFGASGEPGQDGIARHRLDQADRGVLRAGLGLPFGSRCFCERGIGDEKLGRFLAAKAAGEFVDVARLAGGEEADPGGGKLRGHGDIDVSAHRLVRHLEVVVGKAARDLRDIGKAVIDERNPGEFAACEFAVDGRVVGGLDELVGMRRDRGEREGDYGEAGQLESGIGAPSRADREPGKAGSGKRSSEGRWEKAHWPGSSLSVGSCSKPASATLRPRFDQRKRKERRWLAITCAPSADAICTAAEPTPDRPACTSTVSPARSSARRTSMFQAVWNTRLTEAASSMLSPRGLGATLAAGKQMYSAAVPSQLSPKMS